ncbi:MAG: alpha/beta hydrolase [Rhodospirillales bacterium]
MDRRFRRSDSVALNYRDEGSGPPRLFIHGVGSSLGAWDGVIAALPPEGRYLRFDLRGHGASARTAGPYALQDFVDDAVALLDHLGIDKTLLVGFSLGGLIAQAIALAHPERLTGLCLVSTVAGRSAEETARVVERARTLAREGAEAHLSQAVERWFSDAFRAAHPEVLEARRQQSLANDPACYAAAYRVLAENDLGAELAAVTLPTLVMTGEQDSGSSPRMARVIHAAIAGSQLRILPGLKHAVLLEAPGLVAGHIETFLRDTLQS